MITFSVLIQLFLAFPWGKVARRKHPQGVRRIRKAAKLPTTAQPMTDEGNHGGAPVIDGPLGTAAPTKSIVTLCRGGCPHPPVRWPPHPTIPTLIRSLRDHLPPGRGKALLVLTRELTALRRSPHPPQCAHWGAFPWGEGRRTPRRVSGGGL